MGFLLFAIALRFKHDHAKSMTTTPYRTHIQSEPSTSSSTTFAAKNFRLQSFGGPIRIEPHQNGEQTTTVVLVGTVKRRSAIGLSCPDGKTMTLQDDKANDTSGNNVGGISVTNINGKCTVRTGGNSNVGNICVNGMDISVANGVVMVDGVVVNANSDDTTQDDIQLSAVVTVPVGASITIDQLYANAEIGNIGGQLKARVNGVHRLDVDRVSEVELECSGTSITLINDVHGDVTATVSGCSRLSINGGYANTLMLNGSGTSSLLFGGKALRANLSASGCSAIEVARVVGNVTQNKTGVSRINVRAQDKDR